MMADKIKITAEELDLYADVAEIFEEWLEENPSESDETEKIHPDDSLSEQAMKQSRLYAKTYIRLYILFLKLIPRVSKDELDFGKDEIDFLNTKDPNAKAIRKFMAEKQLMDEMSDKDKELFVEKLSEIKETFH